MAGGWDRCGGDADSDSGHSTVSGQCVGANLGTQSYLSTFHNALKYRITGNKFGLLALQVCWFQACFSAVLLLPA